MIWCKTYSPSHLETGDIKMHIEQMDLRKLCEEVVEQFEEKAEKKNIQVRVLADQHAKILVFADWKRISQVVTNLVSNAIKYSLENGEVTITFDVGKKNVTTFSGGYRRGDSGQPFTRIFERFYQWIKI